MKHMKMFLIILTLSTILYGCSTSGSYQNNNHCNIEIILESIEYNGSDIGNDWEFTFYVEGKENGFSLDIDYGDKKNVGRIIYSGNADVINDKVNIRIKALESDWIFDDVFIETIGIDCNKDGPGVTVIPGLTSWSLSYLFGFTSNSGSARMKFNFSVKCKNCR